MDQEIERNIITARAKTLALYFLILQLALQLAAGLNSGDPRMLFPHGVAFLHDFLLLLIVLLCFSMVANHTGGRFFKAAGRTGTVIMFTVGMTLALYPQLLREYLALPANIFSTDRATAWVTVTQYLGIGRLWPVALAVLAGIGAGYRPINIRLEKFWKHPLGWLLILLTAAALVTLPRSPHPLITSIRLQLSESFSSTPRLVPSLRRAPARDNSATLPAQRMAAIKSDSAIDHVFLIVLEGVTSRNFEKEFLTRKSGFYQRVRNRAVWFNNYYTTNLDSYTSLIAMLTAVQVPYRAYTDDSIYDNINTAGNLTRALHSRGHYGLFISTYGHQPFVPTRRDWQRIMDRSDLPSLDGWLSLGTSRMEQATEDMVALNTIVQTAAGNSRSFILHELVYGHSTEWQARTGKSQLEYYDDYLNGLLDQLEARGLDSRSLLVIVSDHGDRAKAFDAENYRVPLLIAGNIIKPATDKEFRTHLDLPAIIAGSMNGTSLPVPREKMFTVGSTERWVYGELRANGDHLFIDDRTGTVPDVAGSIVPNQVQREFQQYLDMFGVQYGN